jgi:hypothetical protein
MPSNKKLVPKTGKLANPEVPVEATNPQTAGPSYGGDARGAADQDGNQEQARRKGAVAPPRKPTDRPRHAKR